MRFQMMEKKKNKATYTVSSWVFENWNCFFGITDKLSGYSCESREALLYMNAFLNKQANKQTNKQTNNLKAYTISCNEIHSFPTNS